MRVWLLTLVLLVFSGCAHLTVPSASRSFDEGEVNGGRVVLRGDLAFAELSGTPEQIGEETAALLGDPIRELRQKMLVDYREYIDGYRSRANALAPHVPDAYRREIAVIASATGVSYEDLVLANTVVDSACTAFVASGAATASHTVLLARNMDFPPAHVLGRYTLVSVIRAAGKKAVVSIGWPGVTGVISGMNEDGLCAAILINFGAGAGNAEATPLAYRVRQMLEECSSVAEASAFVHREKIASDHFVMVADASTGAVLTSRSGDRLLGADGLLTCSNAAFDQVLGVQTDERARALSDLVHESHGKIDAALARRILGATYLEHLNAQAMVFEPATRTLWLARGTTLRPAARQSWSRVNLAGVLAPKSHASIAELSVEDCSREEPFEHYLDHAYAGIAIAPIVAEAAARRLEAVGALDPWRQIGEFIELARSLGSTPRERALRREVGARALACLRTLVSLRDAPRTEHDRTELEVGMLESKAGLLSLACNPKWDDRLFDYDPSDIEWIETVARRER